MTNFRTLVIQRMPSFDSIDLTVNITMSDEILSTDPVIKRHVGRCLRSIAHVIGAALVYYSSQHSALSKTGF